MDHIAILKRDNKLWSVPQMLRHVADEIDAGRVSCDRSVLILQNSEEVVPEYWAVNITRTEISGLGAWLARRAWEPAD